MMTTYTVKAGDSLWSIGRNVVNLNWRYIAALNRDKIPDPNKIYVGQVITIPNPTFVSWLSEFGDLVLSFVGGYSVNLAINVIRFVLEAGSFKKQDVVKFCAQNGIDAIFAGKLEVLHRTIGNSGFTKIYEYWSNCLNYGINKIIDKGEK